MVCFNTTFVIESADFEYAAEEGPTEWDISDKDSGRYFTDVPIKEDKAIRHSEIVVAVKYGC